MCKLILKCCEIFTQFFIFAPLEWIILATLFWTLYPALISVTLLFYSVYFILYIKFDIFFQLEIKVLSVIQNLTPFYEGGKSQYLYNILYWISISFTFNFKIFHCNFSVILEVSNIFWLARHARMALLVENTENQ